MKPILAKFGLFSRGSIYLILALLTFFLAQGGHQEIDQKSALMEVARKPYGFALLGLLALGFTSYALWRFSEALWGGAMEGRRWGRLASFARALIYIFLAFTALTVLRGSKESQSAQFRDFTATLLTQPGGRFLVGAAGILFTLFGIYNMREGWQRKFVKDLDLQSLAPKRRRMISTLGAVGIIARGFLFACTGFMFAIAAWRQNTSTATGLDGALQSLRDSPGGNILLFFLAVGMAAFGFYALVEARFHREQN